jgi:hypothetical protein
MLRFVCLGLMLFIFSVSPSSATRYDYSDAPNYDKAYHATNQWQMLGTKWDKETSPLNQDTSDDGVFWSTDGGKTYGHDDLTIGQGVIFRFDVTRSLSGDHQYDQLKAWIDWDGDKVWDNTAEQIIALQWFKHVKKQDDKITRKSFYTGIIEVPQYAHIGETWLRARVSCDHVKFEDTTPYGYLWQGEVEDWKVNIHAPLPPSVWLFGSGLVGLIGLRRFRKG